MKQNRNVLPRIRNLGKRTGICLAFAVIAAIGYYQYQQEQLAAALSSKILRFHVVANSDGKEDQDLKLKVRDEIGVYMQQELDGITDMEESRALVRADLKAIQKRAEEVVQKEGYGYQVTAAFAQVDFPRKTYGAFTFPQGTYEALQIVIGQGEGKNWWCVMYPNMCFFNSTYEVVEEEAEESLRQVLTAEEYAAVMENGNYEIKFRWLSFLDE